ELFADDYAAVFPGLPEPLNRDGARALFSAFLAAFPGISHRVDELTDGNGNVTVRLWISGVHGGEFMGVLPTGRSIGFAAVNRFDVADGHIRKHVIEFNSHDLMRQLLPAR